MCISHAFTFTCRMKLLSPRRYIVFSSESRARRQHSQILHTDWSNTHTRARTHMHACAVLVYNELLILAMSHDAGFWHSYATVFALFFFVLFCFSRSFCSFCVSFVYEQLHLCLYKVHTWHAVGSVCGHFLVQSNVATTLSNVLPFFARALFVLLFDFSYSL